MPNSETFSIKPIGEFVRKYLANSKVSIDPFARNKRWATYTNDLNPNTEAEHHSRADDFLHWLAFKGVKADLAILDPPYSPRQVSECYQSAGIRCGTEDTQNARMISDVRELLLAVLSHGAIVLSFGWNSVGMGKKHGFEIEEIMLVCHGSAHNDTICMAERKLDTGRSPVLDTSPLV